MMKYDEYEYCKWTSQTNGVQFDFAAEDTCGFKAYDTKTPVCLIYDFVWVLFFLKYTISQRYSIFCVIRPQKVLSVPKA